MGTFIILIVGITSIWVLIDAKKIGVSNKEGGPIRWFIGCLLLWIIVSLGITKQAFAFQIQTIQQKVVADIQEVDLVDLCTSYTLNELKNKFKDRHLLVPVRFWGVKEQYYYPQHQIEVRHLSGTYSHSFPITENQYKELLKMPFGTELNLIVKIDTAAEWAVIKVEKWTRR